MTRLGYQIPNYTYPDTAPDQIFATVVAQAQAAHFNRGVRGKQPRSACAANQLTAQVFRRAVQAVARVAFQRDHLFGNELPGALAQGNHVGWDVEVHARVFSKG